MEFLLSFYLVKYRLAVISTGKGNPFGHPSDEVIGRLEEKLGRENIYRTDESGTDEPGTIEFITDGARLWIKTGR